MTSRTILRGGKCSPVKKITLYLALIGAGLIVFLPIAWVYQKMKSGIGSDVAQITLTFAIVILLGVVLVGMGLAYFIDSAIKKRSFIFRSPQPGSWVDALIRAWGFILVEEQPDDSALPVQASIPEADEILAVLNKPRRRGRKPTYSIDRWKRIVLKWENRDPLRDTMTLADLLAEEFGTHVDGSPKMTEQSYYDWRNRVFAEFKKEAEGGKSPTRLPEEKHKGTQNH